MILYALDFLLAPPGANPGALGPVFQRIALFGPLVQDGEYWRVLGYIFSHGGPIHLAFNMWVGYSIGLPLERAIGSGRFLLLSLITTLGSSALALLFNFDVPTVGASGLILGWAGAMIVIATREYRKSLLFWLAQVAALSLLPGVSWPGTLAASSSACPWASPCAPGPASSRAPLHAARHRRGGGLHHGPPGALRRPALSALCAHAASC